jgi:hypothetical protein
MGMNRWSWVLLLVIFATGLSWYFTRRGGKTAHADCIGDTDCLKGERCAVTPKGDGFVTFGVCSEPCAEASVCLNGWVCTPFAEGKGALYALGSKEAKAAPSGQRVSVCAPARITP